MSVIPGEVPESCMKYGANLKSVLTISKPA